MKGPLSSIYLDGSGGTATFPLCVFFDTAGNQVDPPGAVADSITIAATTARTRLRDLIATATGIQATEVDRWWTNKQVAGMRSGPVTGNPCDVFFGVEQLITPVFSIPVGSRAYLGQLPDEAIGGVNGVPTVPALNPVQCFSFIPDGTDELLISASARKFYGMAGFTIDATPVYLKAYDKATAASESDSPIDRCGVPANSSATLGAGNNRIVPGGYVPLVNGLSIRAVTGIADNNDAALTTAENLVSVYWSE